VNTGSPSEVRAVLTELGIRPSTRLGQNFLIDRNVSRISIERADVCEGDRVLEIGPGLGILTEALLGAGALVHAVEFDRKLHAFLAQRFSDTPELTLVHGDGLDQDFDALFDPNGDFRIRKVVANLPYSSGTRMLVAMIQSTYRPDRIVVTLQREVAQRICAAPGSSAYGLLSVWAQQAYATRLEHRIGARCFWPPPDVESAIAGLERHAVEPMAPDHAQMFYAFTKHAFSQRRKQIGTILKRYTDWDASRSEDFAALLIRLGYDESSRPEAISPDSWVRIAAFLANIENVEA
jgi:16S rRNA (adenine1518-N6/adenine1519-N6)-dimethyltransferase